MAGAVRFRPIILTAAVSRGRFFRHAFRPDLPEVGYRDDVWCGGGHGPDPDRRAAALFRVFQEKTVPDGRTDGGELRD